MTQAADSKLEHNLHLKLAMGGWIHAFLFKGKYRR